MHNSLEKARDRAEDEIRSLRSLVDAMQSQVDELSHAQLWVQEKQRLCVCVRACVCVCVFPPNVMVHTQEERAVARGVGAVEPEQLKPHEL
jgi:hypothetical protein